MSLRALRTLQAIARHGSFVRAGEAVGLTQSAVSLQVRGLEEEFGVQLFDRSRRLPVMTEAGKIVLERSTEILNLYDQIAMALGNEHSLAGRLRLGAIQTALAGILPEALVALNRNHPKIRVHLTAGMSAELASRVASGELDAAITTEPVKPHPPEMVWTPLYQDCFWIVAPPGYTDIPPYGLFSRLPFIRFDSRAWAGRLIERELRRMKIDVQEGMVLDSQAVILRMVRMGLGVTVIPLPEERLGNTGLTYHPFGEPAMSRRVVLLERRDRQTGPLVEELARTVTRLMQQAKHTKPEGEQT